MKTRQKTKLRILVMTVTSVVLPIRIMAIFPSAKAQSEQDRQLLNFYNWSDYIVPEIIDNF